MDEEDLRYVVLNRDRAECHRSKGRKYAIISISDPCSPEPNFVYKDENRIDILSLQFSDFDIERFPDMKKYVTQTNEDEFFKPWIVIFHAAQAKQIFEFFMKHKDNVDYFVVHCEAGISRSPAVAAALSLYESGNDEYFFNKFLPNRYVYRTILNYLDSTGELWKKVQLFRDNRKEPKFL